MGEGCRWLAGEAARALNVIYLLCNRLMIAWVAGEQPQGESPGTERDHASQHPGLGSVLYLHLTAGVSDVLGIHIISNKSLKPHTEKRVPGGLEKLFNFPRATPRAAPPHLDCCFAQHSLS